ncbi:MAG: prolyl oligopeptidase family serine peptidase [Rhodothermales bacterium]|nr:prolyl oligopeptidase family serine peptidase [Rhodothermales bacterium]
MRHLIAFLILIVAASPANAQQESIAAEDYAHAEQYLSSSTFPLVYGMSVRPNWMSGDRFWYRNSIPDGSEFVVVDPVAGTRTRAFDHDRLSLALSDALEPTYSATELPFRDFEFSDDGGSITFSVGREGFRCNLESYACTQEPGTDQQRDRSVIESPDGQRGAFVRDHNLWVRDLESGEERQLTSDGAENYGYATNNAGWLRSDTPVLLWSPDSKKIATFRHDGRFVREMHLTTTNVGHPTLDSWKYPLPGDSLIFRIERVVIDVDAENVVRLQMPPDPHRSTICDHIVCRGEGWADVTWSADSAELAFVSSSRDHKEAKLRVADPESGDVRDVMEEIVDTFYESGFNKVNWNVLHKSNEVIWYSQRDDWGHLYLHDLVTGELRRQITGGPWNVLQVLHIDEDARVIYLTGSGREDGDPYFQYLYKVGIDGGGMTLLTPENASHQISLSPSGAYFVDSYSTPTTPQTTVLRNTDGEVVVSLEQADISKLVDMGWQAPIPFTVKARDGQTDLYGLMYTPTHLDESKMYPVINYIYPGPQTGSVGTRSFMPSRGDKQALAELGFIVVELDAMGTPMRSKSFHAAYYGDMGDNGLPDQIAGIKELGSRYPWMDLERVGIYGHSGGGFASTAGILRYPDFYKVAVSGAGNHDNRNYEDDWAEKWQGLLVTEADGTTNYDNQANQLMAENLKGKLLLAHGTLDDNVPYYNTLLVVDALIAANKDFDLLLFPNRRHGFGREGYMIRRRWDYFVRHLMGAEPPVEYEMGARR